MHDIYLIVKLVISIRSIWSLGVKQTSRIHGRTVKLSKKVASLLEMWHAPSFSRATACSVLQLNCDRFFLFSTGTDLQTDFSGNPVQAPNPPSSPFNSMT